MIRDPAPDAVLRPPSVVIEWIIQTHASQCRISAIRCIYLQVFVEKSYCRVPHPNVVLFDVRVGFPRRVKLRIFLEVEETILLSLLSDIKQHADAHQGHKQR